MGNLIIYSEGNADLLCGKCKKLSEYDVSVKNIEELTEIEQCNPSVIVIDTTPEKLKEITSVTKFNFPVLVVSDEIPENINVRALAYDYIVNPINDFELSIKIKNLGKIKELNDKIQNISTIDELTGLHNRKYLLERLDSELSRAKRYNTPVSCILFDLDFFKTVNDMYGYEWGDVLLKKVSEMLAGLARKEDIVTRYGDEEFLVVLPETSEEKAFIFAERFRRDIEKMTFIPAGEDEKHPVRISGGISSYPYLNGNEEDANTLIRYAEHSLYTAKKRGKNRVVMFSQVNLDF